MVIYSYPVEKKGKEISSTIWIIKKEKSTGTLGMYFSCFRPFWVWGVTLDAEIVAAEEALAHAHKVLQDLKVKRQWVLSSPAIPAISQDSSLLAGLIP